MVIVLLPPVNVPALCAKLPVVVTVTPADCVIVTPTEIEMPATDTDEVIEQGRVDPENVAMSEVPGGELPTQFPPLLQTPFPAAPLHVTLAALAAPGYETTSNAVRTNPHRIARNPRRFTLCSI